jgi:O-antigen/teichoic acid export membrane protein
MSTKRFLKGASLVTASQLLVAACSFLRNIVISRHISVEDFGIAVIFAMVVTLLEMTSYLALDNFLVQNDEGGSDAMLASAHALQFLRGVAGALLLFLLASPLASVFKVPDITWAFQLLALLPLVRGLVHYDMVVRKRHMDFRATAIVDATPALLSLGVAYFAALWFEDYRVMLAVVFTEATLRTVTAHLLAHRPYRWSFRRDLIDKKLRFGWPLLVNGLLLFGIFQGDRAIVGALFDLKTLGWFGAAFSLVLMPGLLFARISSTLLGPGLARHKHDVEQFRRECGLALALCFGCAAFIAVFFAVSGKALMLLAFGHRYAEANDLLLLLALAQAIRIIRVAPSMISTSQARTTNAMYANLVRILGLPLAAGFALMGYSIEWVALCALVGEAMATLFAFRILDVSAFRARFMALVWKMGAVFSVLAIGGYVLYLFIPDEQSIPLGLTLLAAGGVASLVAAAGVAALDGDVRSRAASLVRKILKYRRGG